MNKSTGGLALVILTCLASPSAMAQFNEVWAPNAGRYNGSASGNDRAI